MLIQAGSCILKEIHFVAFDDDSLLLFQKEFKRMVINLNLPRRCVQKVLLEKILLVQGSDEYKKAASRFKIANLPPSMTLVEMYQIKARNLKRKYNYHKDDMLNNYVNHPNIQCNIERDVFHGTKEFNAMQILDEGFNPAFSSRNPGDTVYGQGCYFARDLSYSADDDYSVPNAKGLKFVFVVQLLVGATFRVHDTSMSTLL